MKAGSDFDSSEAPSRTMTSSALLKTYSVSLVQSWASRLRTWDDAVSVLRERIEALGVLIVINGCVGNNSFRVLDPEEFRGFVISDVHAPLIFVNGHDAKSAQVFTMFHELAHLWFNRSGLLDLKDLAVHPALPSAAFLVVVPFGGFGVRGYTECLTAICGGRLVHRRYHPVWDQVKWCEGQAWKSMFLELEEVQRTLAHGMPDVQSQAMAIYEMDGGTTVH